MIRKTYVDTSIGQIHVRLGGVRGRGLPLVLLHQTASSGEMFDGLIRELERDHWIAAPDTPGFGNSAALAEPASIALYARVLAEALARLEIDECLLFGHHTGASIAVQMVHDRPALARRLALSGPPYLTPERRAALRATIEPVVVDEDGQHLLRVWRRLRAKDADAPLALVHREAVLTLLAGERYHEAYEAVFDHPFEAQLAGIACPTLVLGGDRDTLHASLAPAFASLRHGAMREIPGGTTYVVDRAPGTLAEILREFFRDPSAR